MNGPWHATAPEALAGELHTSLDSGLSGRDARERLAAQGPNVLPEAPPASPLRLFLAQFESLIIWVLIGAAVLSGLLGEWVDLGAILAIVLLNALLGFVQEYKAERSLAALKKLSTATARVIRDGAVHVVPASDLVPGDLILVEAGDHVPADARLVYATALRTHEASLTGESTPVDKTARALTGDRLPLADRTNLLFLGTSVTAGKGRALVVATGTGTELGRIASLLQKAPVEPTPLQKRLGQLGHFLLFLSLGIVTVVFLLGLWRGEPLVGMFLTAVSLAVAAIPEGLPAIVTMTLALGVTRMARRHALIRRLPAVETLGSTTVICTDKTGTLTKNEMTVTRLFLPGRLFEVTGEGYAPTGEIRQWSMVNGQWQAGHEPSPVTHHPSPITHSSLRELLSAFALCNGASLREEEGAWRIVGDPTEGALLVAAAKLGLWKEPLEADQPLLGEAPFDPERKLMTMVRQSRGGPVAYVKGAPDVLLLRCTHHLTEEGRIEPLGDAVRKQILEANGTFAQEALRVLGAARRPLDRAPTEFRADELERELIFLGLAAMKDPLRPEALRAVQAAREAGIKTVMITGDHKETAIAIARELGLLDGRDRLPGEPAPALSGTELDDLTDEALAEQVERIAVYARVSAEHKLRIVRAWKARGAIAAMTGDGVNDAPAVKEAHVGVAMGLTGTDVTKEASDMVVTDDNFASIEAAVEEGRTIYDNIRKSVHYLLSCNLSEVLVMLLAALLDLPLPLLPVQILWINLVTDGLPALALAVDPADPDLMRRPPRRPKARFLERERVALMFAQGSFMALVTIAAFAYCLYGMDQNLDRARTVTFTVLVMAQLFHSFNCRSDRHSLVSIGWRTNPHLLWAVGGSTLLQTAIISTAWSREVFKVAPFNPEHWLFAFGLGLLPLLAMEVWKAGRRGRGPLTLLCLGALALSFLGPMGCTREGEEPRDAKPPTDAARPGVVRLKPEAAAAAGVAVQPIRRGEFRQHRDFPATVQPNQNELAEVTTLVRGRVVEVYVDFGQDVKKGTELARLDSSELGLAEADYLKDLAKLHEAERAYERARDLLHDKAISLAEFQRKEAEALGARSEARESRNRLGVLGVNEEEIARLEKEQTIRSTVSIKAPFAGRIIKRNVARGEVMETTDELFTLADLSDVWVIANVPEKDVRFIKSSHVVDVRLAAYPNEVFHGKITYVGDVLDPATRTMKLRVTVPNPDGRLKPEMFATVRVYGEPERQALAVPLSAVLRDAGAPMVFVLAGPGQFEARAVKLGEESAELVKVLDGLREGEQVVTAGAFALKSEAEKYKIEPTR
ncbi:MAG: HAD-IC family P-type ATPase [Nitrospirota bacterium]